MTPAVFYKYWGLPTLNVATLAMTDQSAEHLLE
jgi:hypothetical protein